MKKDRVGVEKKNVMTRFTYEALQKEVAKASEDVGSSLKRIGEAAGTESDWHDNAAFDFANVQHDVNSSRLGSIMSKLKNVEFIEPPEKVDNVSVGTTVVVKFQGENEDESFTVLGPADSGRKEGWISYDSPLGSNLLGKKTGEEAVFSVQDRQQKVKVVKILPGEFD